MRRRLHRPGRVADQPTSCGRRPTARCLKPSADRDASCCACCSPACAADSPPRLRRNRVSAGVCESVRPFRGGHHASGPLAIERNQQEGRLGYRSLGLDECFDAATGSGELSQMRRHGVVDSATLRRIAALFLDPGRRPPEPTSGGPGPRWIGKLVLAGLLGCLGEPRWLVVLVARRTTWWWRIGGGAAG